MAVGTTSIFICVIALAVQSKITILVRGKNMEKNDIVAHLNMIQGVISRLETNSFTLKALAITLASAVLTFIGTLQNPNWVFAVAGYMPILIFWIMDAHYLRLGRMFRELYNAVRLGEVKDPFTMNYWEYGSKAQCTLRIALSWSISWFYFVILLAFAIITLYLIRGPISYFPNTIIL